jgi:hypothetical protein
MRARWRFAEYISGAGWGEDEAVVGRIIFAKVGSAENNQQHTTRKMKKLFTFLKRSL